MVAGGGQPPKPTSSAKTGNSDIKLLLQNLFPGTLASAARMQPRPMRRDWATVVCFSCGRAGHGATRCPDLNEAFPFMLPGWKAEKVGGGYVMISPMWQWSIAGRETTTDPERGVSRPDQLWNARISYGTRPRTLAVVRRSSLPPGMWPCHGRCFSLHHSRWSHDRMR